MKEGSLLLGLALATCACGTDRLDHGRTALSGDGGAGGYEVAAQIVGSAGHPVPAAAKVVVVWKGGLGGLERLYKQGEGTATLATVSLRLTTPPVAAALLDGTTGIGLLYLLPSAESLPDGEVAQATLEQKAIGAAASYLIVYRPATPAMAWMTAFPLGYGCAGPSEERPGDLDAHTPIACSEVKVEVGDIRTLTYADWR